MDQQPPTQQPYQPAPMPSGPVPVAPSRIPMLLGAFIAGAIVVALGVWAYTEFTGEPEISPTPSASASAIPNATDGWTNFNSKYFALSFRVPSFTEVVDQQNYIRVAKSPYTTHDIGGDNAFLTLTRYINPYSKTERIADYRKTLKNIQESMATVDGSSFFAMRGDDIGRYEGDSAGKVIVVFFDASWLEIIERPGNSDQNFDPITIGGQILSTFKFTTLDTTVDWKTYTNTEHGFEIKYPTNWIFSSATGSVQVVSPETAQEIEQSHAGGFVSAGKLTFQSTKSSSVDAYMNNLPAACKQNMTATTVGGVKAYKYIACDGGSPTYVTWIRSGIIYNYSWGPGDYQTILSTFKFTK